jgi:hypothetical protein
VFGTFSAGALFTEAMSRRTHIIQRVVAAQDSTISSGFTPLTHLFNPGQSLVLAIIDETHLEECRSVCDLYGGTLQVWRREEDGESVISLGLMVYGHRMLWIKKLASDAAFLHTYFSPEQHFQQLTALRERFGPRIWLEFKYIRSGWLRALHGLPAEGTLAASLLTLVPGDETAVRELMKVCDEIGMWYQNPHTFRLDENGLFPDFAQILAFKRRVDPYLLLNPGKIGERILREA